MSRGERNLTVEEWDQIQQRKVGDALASAPARTTNEAKPAHSKGLATSRMNRWESEYAMELEARKRAGEILWYGHEAITLRLADRTRYTPDFAVMTCATQISPVTFNYPSLIFIEVKGFLRDDANVKFKVAAALFPWAEFLMYRKKQMKEGGGWELIKHLNGGV